MKEWVVLSGKGGTGKTSVTASLARLSGPSVLVDADVDASNLALLFDPAPKHREDFYSGETASILIDRCASCGLCTTVCRSEAFVKAKPGQGAFRIDPTACSGCGGCVEVCLNQAVKLSPRLAGEWFISMTDLGPIVHAELLSGAGHSGKLAAFVRDWGKKICLKSNYERIWVDGPPGTGCPVHATLSGAGALLLVAEPGLSGVHDAERILDLAASFGIPTALCVNKWDLDPEGTANLEKAAEESGAQIAGRIRFDQTFRAALRQGMDIIRYDPGSAGALDVKSLWNCLVKMENSSAEFAVC